MSSRRDGHQRGRRPIFASRDKSNDILAVLLKKGANTDINKVSIAKKHEGCFMSAHVSSDCSLDEVIQGNLRLSLITTDLQNRESPLHGGIQLGYLSGKLHRLPSSLRQTKTSPRLMT